MPELPRSAADVPEQKKINLIPILIDGEMYMKTETEALEIADQILMIVLSKRK